MDFWIIRKLNFHHHYLWLRVSETVQLQTIITYVTIVTMNMNLLQPCSLGRTHVFSERVFHLQSTFVAGLLLRINCQILLLGENIGNCHVKHSGSRLFPPSWHDLHFQMADKNWICLNWLDSCIVYWVLPSGIHLVSLKFLPHIEHLWIAFNTVHEWLFKFDLGSCTESFSEDGKSLSKQDA